MVYCNEQFELFNATLPPSYRPKDIWWPIVSYLLERPADIDDEVPGEEEIIVSGTSVITKPISVCLTKLMELGWTLWASHDCSLASIDHPSLGDFMLLCTLLNRVLIV